MAATNTDTNTNIAAAIKWLLRSNPRHQLMTDSRALEEMVMDIQSASDEYGQNPFLITAMTFKESTFRPRARGKRGEVGLIQVGYHVQEECEADDFDLDLAIDQLRCGARHLKSQTKRCRGLWGGLVSYATGECHTKPFSNAFDAVLNRLWLARKLAKKFGGD